MNSIERLAKAIDYPGAVPAGSSAFVFQVDGGEMRAVEQSGRLVLSRLLRIEGRTADLVQLAGYAAGRMLKEDAVLAWEVETEAPLLWQDIAANASDELLLRFFEVFATSCDWWLARLEESGNYRRMPEMMIMP